MPGSGEVTEGLADGKAVDETEGIASAPPNEGMGVESSVTRPQPNARSMKANEVRLRPKPARSVMRLRYTK